MGMIGLIRGRGGGVLVLAGVCITFTCMSCSCHMTLFFDSGLSFCLLRPLMLLLLLLLLLMAARALAW